MAVSRMKLKPSTSPVRVASDITQLVGPYADASTEQVVPARVGRRCLPSLNS